MSNFALLDTTRGDDNPVHQPRSARTTRGNHKWDGTIVNNQAVGYVPVVYQHQEYPRMMYHPEWGALAKPDMQRFAVGCRLPEDFTAALEAFNKATDKWNRSNRVKIAADAKEEGRLKKIGWLLQPPMRESNPAFDMGSDEI